MSFLSKLASLRKSAPAAPIIPNNINTKKDETKEHSLLPQNYIREADPAVQRLKELRRKELLQKGELTTKKKRDSRTSGTRRSKNDDNGATETRFKRKPSNNTALEANRNVAVARKKTEPVKKMSFQELMKQAENNAKEPKVKSDEVSGHKLHLKGLREKSPILNPAKSVELKKSSANERNRKPSSQHLTRHRTVSPEISSLVKIKASQVGLAQPNKKIREKLESKRQDRMHKRREQEYESDMDDFIEDDEEDDGKQSSHDVGFDRNEIWAMFNRGKKRSDYAFDDYEDDDMEANEMEILEEEERARKMARLEDKREEEWLKNHDREKKRRKATR
ncbi:hypothetical protein HG535_0B02770 [Zygotorulaspora mrakii]|uniref:Uncharacterized protein n=1 Tax=Zygotorulaspora mrakii TaxID=42260 RepID=A0A7H9AXU7_ZYGMR|nr:uncharacterized protein HG535_0B02770 [Zygotorulaspora mrakii]QLG71238.1 hypothetical protein HG535_0B02770 [Zygotorulaspora mrakii]